MNNSGALLAPVTWSKWLTKTAIATIWAYQTTRVTWDTRINSSSRLDWITRTTSIDPPQLHQHNHFQANHIVDMVQSTPSFVDPFADITLVSCDGVEFPVAKAVMAMVSTVFEGMFQLPQNKGVESISDEQDLDKTVANPHSSFSRFPLSDDSHTLDEFLSLIYRKKSIIIDEYTGEES